nr:MAG TPA: hypothetical protein [Caudoviricetes sp.]
MRPFGLKMASYPRITCKEFSIFFTHKMDM